MSVHEVYRIDKLGLRLNDSNSYFAEIVKWHEDSEACHVIIFINKDRSVNFVDMRAFEAIDYGDMVEILKKGLKLWDVIHDKDKE